jgi:hypothetical protein
MRTREHLAELDRRLADEAAEVHRLRVVGDLLGQYVPGWFLLYGPATRKFWAFPTWPNAPENLVLSHADPEVLRHAIHGAEVEHSLRPPSTLRGGVVPEYPHPRGLHPADRAAPTKAG